MVEFNPKNFRRIAEDNKPDFKIRTADHSTLVLVKRSGEAWYARTRGDRDQLVERFGAGDLLLWAWVGQYYTDIFLLSAQDLERYYR